MRLSASSSLVFLLTVCSVTAWQTGSPRRTLAPLCSVATTDTTQDSTPTTASSQTTSKQKVAVLLCPAQFCVPEDYTDFWPTLRQTLANGPIQLADSSRVVPLSRLDWIKVAQQLPTMDFVQAQLPVRPTLYWFFDAIETALADILAAEGPDVSIVVVGHSIGGWVARAFLGVCRNHRQQPFVWPSNNVPDSSLWEHPTCRPRKPWWTKPGDYWRPLKPHRRVRHSPCWTTQVFV